MNSTESGTLNRHSPRSPAAVSRAGYDEHALNCHLRCPLHFPFRGTYASTVVWLAVRRRRGPLRFSPLVGVRRDERDLLLPPISTVFVAGRLLPAGRGPRRPFYGHRCYTPCAGPPPLANSTCARS